MRTTEEFEAFNQELTLQRARELAGLKLENRAMRALQDSLESRVQLFPEPTGEAPVPLFGIVA